MPKLPEPAALPPFEFVDAHCHVDLFSNPADLVAEAERARVLTIAVTNAPFVFDHTRSLAAGSRFVVPALGLHPELVASRGREVATLRERIGDARFIGEVGLDYTTGDQTARGAQRRVFEEVLDCCARAGGKILTVHSRRAARDVISAIGQGYPCSVILHWFSGTARELASAAACGAYFSVNAAMLESKSGRTLVAAMPRHRVLTESDGPFVRRAGSPDSPKGMRAVVEALARQWGVPGDEAALTVRRNFTTCIGSPNIRAG